MILGFGFTDFWIENLFQKLYNKTGAVYAAYGAAT